MQLKAVFLISALSIATRTSEAHFVATGESGVDESLAEKWILEFAPEVRLHPDDWTRPSNVDAYLAKSSLRFGHEHCADHDVLAAGEVTQASLSEQTHATTDFFCDHTSTIERSRDEHREFFLHADPSVRDGMKDPSAWRVYAHVKKSAVVTGGFDVQFWFFYPYDFAKYGLNHEGDWEHVTVSIDAEGSFVSAWYAQHTYGERFSKDDLAWSGTHPVVYSAIGTHASYPRASSWPTHYPTFADRTADGGPVWKGWQNVVNVGDEEAPMHGQAFIRYGGLWGADGIPGKAAPRTPAFQSSWTKY